MRTGLVFDLQKTFVWHYMALTQNKKFQKCCKNAPQNEQKLLVDTGKAILQRFGNKLDKEFSAELKNMTSNVPQSYRDVSFTLWSEYLKFYFETP